MSVRRRWAWPLTPLYGAAVAAKDALRAAGLSPERRLQWPVLSVGSLSAGGAGKTPVTIALAKLLQSRGWTVDVLSRGYGRSGSGVELVDADVADAAHRFGDEPVLIRQRTGCPVWVGGNRFAAGKLAERRWAEQLQQPDPGEAQERLCVHILDDGMQHRALHRDFELVLLTAEDLQDTLLPGGNLREPLQALRRADALAVREEELEVVSEWLARTNAAEVPVWTVRRALRFPPPLGVFGAGLRPLAFCALARPSNFAAMLQEAGCGIADTMVFPDHHRYSERDLQLMAKWAGELRATGLITTEKDAVKLPPAVRERLEREIGPLIVVRLQTSFVYEAPVMRALQGRFRSRQPPEPAVETQAR